MRLKQWNADLMGLVLRQSNSPLTLSNQQKVTIKNNALVITRYSRACIFKQFQKCQKCQFGPSREQFCNPSLFSIHNKGLGFWQLELYTIIIGTVYNRLYCLLNLAWPIDFETLQKFLRLRLCCPLHFCGEDFKKWGRLRKNNFSSLLKFLKDFLTLQVTSRLSKAKLLASTYIPFLEVCFRDFQVI